jgi:hypothetical protein
MRIGTSRDVLGVTSAVFIDKAAAAARNVAKGELIFWE